MMNKQLQPKTQNGGGSVKRKTKRYVGRLKKASDSNTNAKGSNYSAFSDSHQSNDDKKPEKSGLGNRSMTPDYSSNSSSSSESFKIDIKELGRFVKILLPYAHTRLEDLSSEINDKLNIVTLITKTSSGMPLHEDVRKATLSIFGSVDPTKIRPNTVASKLLGCTISKCPEVPLGCGPLCAGALGSDSQNGEGWSPCEHAVYLFEGDNFSILTHGSSSGSRSAYVYVHKYFGGFGPVHVSQLRQNNIDRIKLVYLDDDTECSQITPEFTSVEKFIKDPSQNHHHSNQHHSSNGSNGGWWVFFIIILLVLIAVGVFYVYKNNPERFGGSFMNGMSSGFENFSKGTLTPPGTPIFGGWN